MNVLPGESISIYLGGAATSSCVAVRMFHGRVAGVTDKAVKITPDNAAHCLWVPKKALVVEPNGFDSYKLAKWFKLNGFAQWFFEYYGRVSGISA